MTTGDLNSHIGGILNMTGTRPGSGFRYEGATMPDQISFGLTFTTTYEAIEALIVPPPLKVDRSLPPEVRATYFINRGNRAFDGRLTPYHAFLFMANTTHDGKPGTGGWEFVDALDQDKSRIDIMGPWGVYFGMLKKMADIRFLPVNGDEFEITVDRRGSRLVTMRLRIGEAMSDEEVRAMNEPAGAGIYTVREIPDANYTAYVDRAVCLVPGNDTKVAQAWRGSDGSIEFGGIDLDPFDQMPVLGVSNAMSWRGTTPKSVFSEIKVVEELAREPEQAQAAE